MQRKTERDDQLERLRRRYAGRAKAGKGRLLDEFCEHHGYEPKYAIKLLQGGRAAVVAQSRPGPERKYEPVGPVASRLQGAGGRRLERDASGHALAAPSADPRRELRDR